MNKPIAILAGAAALLAAGASPATPSRHAPQAGKEASIPFVNHGGIYDWEAVDRDTLYVQDRARRWYRAELLGPCIDLPFALNIGFETRGDDRFDRFSSVIVGRQRCAVQSLVASDPPPKRVKQKKHG